MRDPEVEHVIRTLIAGGESYAVEFKTAWEFGPEGKVPRSIKSVAKDIGEAIVAFANTDGGDLLVGVEDSGSVTGVPWEGDELMYLVQAPRHQVKDADLGVRVHDVEIDGRRVLLFRVGDHPSAVVVIADGRCLWRRGAPARTEPVPPGEIARRRDHRLGDTAYEAQLVHEATLDDLEIPAELLASKPHLAGLGDLRTLLRYWNLSEGRNGSLLIRRAALLLFAKEPLRWHPNNRLRIRRVHGPAEGYGRQLGTRESEVLGPIVRIFPAAAAALHSNLAVEARTSSLFTTAQVLPPEAVDECIVNAVAHRNYAIEGAAIEVLLFPDRVEFKSPGKLPEPLTPEDLRKQQGAHRSRNPLITRVLRDLGWSRDQGEGMRRIFGSMAQVELHAPELEQRADTFIVRLSTRSRYDEETQAMLAAYGPFGLEPRERKYIVALARAGGRLSVDRLARTLGVSFDAAKRSLLELDRKGLVWHGARSRTYHLVSPLSVPHERALRRLRKMGVQLNASTIINTGQLHLAFGATALDALRESGIVAPAGKGQWKLGSSLLEYARQRDASG
ncbi:ATP-binding protein [Sorangium cellulosum]|uniref:ATP-binding protein n=1 Tax=Sorangium cellulosum TaxID=56 RepID=UPI0013EA9998|nr:ATP-binding protein [Sorangium cellulosum]